MFKFLALLLAFGVFGFLILVVFLGRVIRFFGPPKKENKTNRRRTTGSQPDQANAPQKKFSKGEGEYINYEEVRGDE